MVTDDDIVELVIDTLKGDSWKEVVAAKTPAANAHHAPLPKRGFFAREKYIKSSATLPKGRRFITEYEVKQMLRGGAVEITVPCNAIISPLAQEVLSEKGIRVVRSNER